MVFKVWVSIFFSFFIFVGTVGAQALVEASNWANWQIGSQSGGDAGVRVIEDDEVLIGRYPSSSGGMHAWAGFDLSSLDAQELFVEFSAKLPIEKHGLKFLKIFGKSADGFGYANVTFGLDYTGIDNGAMLGVSFGDGTNLSNDTQNMILFTGDNLNWVGRSYPTAIIDTPQFRSFASTDWADAWHNFKFMVKFNSVEEGGEEIPDGAFYVEIDGKVFLEATGILNRHKTNLNIDRVALLDWSQGAGSEFEVWYKDVFISTESFKNTSVLPNPPTSLRAN